MAGMQNLLSRSWKSILVAFVGVFVLTVVQLSSPKNNEITFTIPINTEAFDQDATLQLELWHVEPGQIKEEIQEPEEYRFQVSQIAPSVQITSTQVIIGDTYTLKISGLDADGCNTTFAEVSDKVEATSEYVDIFVLHTTLMKCGETITVTTTPLP